MSGQYVNILILHTSNISISETRAFSPNKIQPEEQKTKWPITVIVYQTYSCKTDEQHLISLYKTYTTAHLFFFFVFPPDDESRELSTIHTLVGDHYKNFLSIQNTKGHITH